ncbi:hypothetical protein K435DRAFT_641686, partial [Dendrothele bispora CBS 962.96]
QRLFDARNLSFGVQWEIHRVINANELEYSQIPVPGLDKLQQLGSCKEAVPQVENIIIEERNKKEIKSFRGNINPFAEEIASIFPWEEFDCEEKALQENPHAGLGCDDNSSWFGGKVIFRLSLRKNFEISLEKAELGASNRFTRRWGSKSFVRVKISKELWNSGDALVNFFRRPFIICGRIFRAFLEKDKTVFLFMTNETLNPSGQISSTEGISFEEFLESHNPLSRNQKQSAAKYASRFALGLSTSAPGLRLRPENIFEEDDIGLFSAEGSDMTDGAGYINRTGLRKLNHKFGWHDRAVAIQCRIGGAKGMLSEHPTDDHDEPRVWLRSSQIKIKYDPLIHEPELQTIDVLRSSHSHHGCRLSAETIIILADNGVPNEVFANLMEEKVKDVVAAFTSWEGPNAMLDLYSTVDRAGGVTSARKARLEPGMARLRGYKSNDNEAQEEGEEEDQNGLDQLDTAESSVAWWADEISGQPSSLEETVMYVCASGFTPQTCFHMKEKLKHIFNKEIEKLRTFRVDVRMACTAFILPDPLGLLEDGEIYFKSSRRNLLNRDGSETDIVTGPVLVTRHPCKLPTDIQKWTAVDKREYREFIDVIYFSTKGSRRPADYLGGGDYDGDKCLLIYQPELVEPFQNADLSFADPRDDIKEQYFSRHTETVEELLQRAPPTEENPLARVHALQEYLLGGLKTPSLVGQASNMHDCSLYMHGPRHKDSILLAHIFCHTLDGAKTGLKPIPEKMMALRRKYDKGPMYWKTNKSSDAPVSRQSNVYVGHPSRKRPPFVMDYLKQHALEMVGIEKDRVNKECFDSIKVLDEHLVTPWREAKELASRMRKATNSDVAEKELEAIEKHVVKMFDVHRERTKEKNFTGKRIETRQNILRSISREFSQSPSPSDLCTMTADQIARVRASYAYLYDHQKAHRPRFSWDVSMRELCAIKAKALGRWNTVTGTFYDSFTIRKSR